MKYPLNRRRLILLVLFVLCFFLTIVGCSSGPDMESQLTGKWQRTQGEGTVDINLAGSTKTVALDGHTFPAVVEKIDKGTFTVKLKVEVAAGKSEEWSLTQRWNDNGSSFKIAFRHNGTTETLVPAGQS